MFQKQQSRWVCWFVNVSCSFLPSVYSYTFILISFPFFQRLKSWNYNAVRTYVALRLSKCWISLCSGFKYPIVHLSTLYLWYSNVSRMDLILSFHYVQISVDKLAMKSFEEREEEINRAAEMADVFLRASKDTLIMTSRKLITGKC